MATDPLVIRWPHPRFVGFLAVFAVAGVAASLWQGPHLGLIFGFDLAALLFCLSCLPLWRDDHLAAIRARAARDDGGRVLLPLVSILSLMAVAAALVLMIRGREVLNLAELALVAASLGLAWLFVNLIFAFHYSNIYHSREAGGLDFPGHDAPLFADFCYFAFVVGMTCQVSDVPITKTDLRRVATIHGLVAFVFNLGVLALMVNVMAGVL